MKKRIYSLILALTMIFTIIPVMGEHSHVHAADYCTCEGKVAIANNVCAWRYADSTAGCGLPCNHSNWPTEVASAGALLCGHCASWLCTAVDHTISDCSACGYTLPKECSHNFPVNVEKTSFDTETKMFTVGFDLCTAGCGEAYTGEDVTVQGTKSETLSTPAACTVDGTEVYTAPYGGVDLQASVTDKATGHEIVLSDAVVLDLEKNNWQARATCENCTYASKCTFTSTLQSVEKTQEANCNRKNCLPTRQQVVCILTKSGTGIFLRRFTT